MLVFVKKRVTHFGAHIEKFGKSRTIEKYTRFSQKGNQNEEN